MLFGSRGKARKWFAVRMWAGGRRMPAFNRCEPVPDKAGNQRDRPERPWAGLNEFPDLAGWLGDAGEDGINNYKDRKPNDSW